MVATSVQCAIHQLFNNNNNVKEVVEVKIDNPIMPTEMKILVERVQGETVTIAIQVLTKNQLICQLKMPFLKIKTSALIKKITITVIYTILAVITATIIAVAITIIITVITLPFNRNLKIMKTI